MQVETLKHTQDYTPTGLRQEGAFENDRNADARDLFKSIIREVFNVSDVIIAHHLVYVAEEKRADGFAYQVVEEIPSADALIFDHGVARKLWGNGWQDALVRLAMEPCDTRDALLAKMYYGRTAGNQISVKELEA